MASLEADQSIGKDIICIDSHTAHIWDFPVIIDNLMNLELLCWAARESGDKRFFNIAVSHADTTLKNHFRRDNSSWHVIDYDPKTGAVQKRNTHQGYSDDSSGSRGQAWGLYGYAMCYRETVLKHPRAFAGTPAMGSLPTVYAY